MDHGIETLRMPRSLRLLLTFLGVLFGMLVLGLVFGSSSASADEGPDAEGTLTGTVATVTHSAPAATITAPVLETITEVAPVLLPVTPVLEPVTTLVDTTVAAIDDSIVLPALHAIEGLARTGRDVLAVAPAASWTPVTAIDVAGDAIGSLDLLLSSPLGTANLNASPTGAAPLATALGAGLVVLLIARRIRVPDGAVPASVVYDTDSSPD